MQQYAQAGQLADQPSSAALNQINLRLRSLNEDRGRILSSLEDKLHLILNKRSPDKQTSEQSQPKMSDKLNEIASELSISENQNLWLQKLNDHLSEIISQ